ncbi:MAG TPA: hypothetical protein VL651_13810 [Bacteroidia bacterium]|nr:hypothetical protein [Bacteroidia bacterium]
MKRTLLYTALLLVMFTSGCSGCKHLGKDKKYAPCHCDQVS